MTPEVKHYLRTNVIPEFNKWLAKELNIEEIENIEAAEFKIEALARQKAVKLAKKFVNKITENEFSKDIKEDFGSVDFLVERK